MATATWNNQVIAQADDADIIRIEGNVYFPPAAVNQDFLRASDYQTTCFWKGEASYYSVVVEGQTNEDAAWYYPQPMDGAAKQVGQDFANYVAFWRGVEVS